MTKVVIKGIEIVRAGVAKLRGEDIVQQDLEKARKAIVERLLFIEWMTIAGWCLGDRGYWWRGDQVIHDDDARAMYDQEKGGQDGR